MAPVRIDGAARPPSEIMHPIKQRSIGERLRDKLTAKLDHRIVRWMQLGATQQAWYLNKVFGMLDVDLVIDVGGNVGKFASLVRDRARFRGPIISVEPVPRLAQTMRERLGRDRLWDVATCALGECAGTAVINVTRAHEMSSILTPDSSATDRLERLGQVVERIEVEVITLGQLLERHPLARGCRSVYLKLDVQGYEMHVLRGATDCLDRVVALQAEASVIPIYKDVPVYHELMRSIEAMGYQLSFMPAHDYTQVPDMIDFDCHFVSRRALAARGYIRPSGADVPPPSSTTAAS